MTSDLLADAIAQLQEIKLLFYFLGLNNYGFSECMNIVRQAIHREYQAEKIDGVWEQRFAIHYNCVGTILIPDVLPPPAPEVSVNTRRGVVVNYTPSTTTI